MPTETPRSTLLVVDDQPANIRVLHGIFADEHQVLMATSGPEALRVCREQRPDLVLLDVVMPGMDGHEVCRHLKADPLTRGIPVIFVTAQDDAEQEALGLEIGAADFIVKPIHAAVILARVRTHLRLTRSRSVLAATLEATADGILVSFAGGAIGGVNGTFARMWGLPEAPGTRPARLALLEAMAAQVVEGDRFAAMVADAMENGLPDGRTVAFELSGDRHFECRTTELSVSGRAAGQVLSFRDVSERTRATRRLERLNETLEGRIAERTRELEEAMRRAESANHAKSAFLSNMSHEIRTPIHGVIGAAHLALRGDPPPQQRDYLDKIRSAGEHLLGIVNQILDLSKIEAGMLRLEAADFDLAEQFERVAAETSPLAQAKGLALSFHVAPELGRRLHGDAMRLRQVLMNFVSNAIKFSERGRITVRAHAPSMTASGALLRIEVNDQGIGLAPEQAALLFQPFHQADAATTRLHGGTGLGLAISRQIAECMGGRVGVDSRPGEGSTFWFTAQLGWATSHGTDAPERPAPAPTAVALAGVRVLVVDDNPLNLDVAARLLEDAGAAVATAADGRAALDILRTQACDVVLMDLQMPGMDGFEATRRIRAALAHRTLPVIAVSADSPEARRSQCAEAGLNDFLSKPFLPEALYAAVARWLPVAEVADEPAIDLAVLRRAVNGDDERFRRYAAMFVTTTEETLAELANAAADGHLDTVADLGHRLKSSARYVGAHGLAAQCETLETLRGGDPLRARAPVEAMALKFHRIRADIQEALSVTERAGSRAAGGGSEAGQAPTADVPPGQDTCA